MSSELLRYQDGQVTLSDAVVRVARALNPLGAAADIVATVGACVVEIGRFTSQAAELKVRHDVASGIIRTRQGAIIGLFEAQKRVSASTYVDLAAIRECLRGMLHISMDMRHPRGEREVAQGTVVALADKVVTVHVEAGRSLVRLSDSLRLRDTEAAISSWRALER